MTLKPVYPLLLWKGITSICVEQLLNALNMTISTQTRLVSMSVLSSIFYI